MDDSPSSRLIDLGDVWVRESVPVSITLVNPGSADFPVRNVVASCGCTVPETIPRLIPAGASEELLVMFRAPGRAQRRTSRIRVIPADEDSLPLEITLTANVVEVATLSPEQLTFRPSGREDDADVETLALALTNTSGEPLRVTGITASPPGVFTVEAQVSALEPGEVAEIVVAYHPSADAGPMPGLLEIALDHEEAPSLTATLSVHIESGTQVNPGRVWFGRVSQGEVLERTVLVSNSRHEDFEVIGASTDSPGVSVEITPGSPGESQVTLTLDSRDLEPGLVNGELLVRTNVPHENPSTVRVLGIIRPQ